MRVRLAILVAVLVLAVAGWFVLTGGDAPPPSGAGAAP
jgi:hypothetical protein